MQIRFARPFVLLGLLFAALVLPACDALNSGKPAVIIAAPPSGSTYREGDDVAVQSTSADKTGVVRIEMTVDGAVVRNDTPPAPQLNFSLIQTWKATPGSHTIIVRAYNAAGAASDPAAITIQVSPSIALGTSSSASSLATSSASSGITPPASASSAPPPSSSSVASTSSATACTDNAAFVSHVTVPDGTAWAPGQAFNKIWRLSNTGNCPWGPGYQFIFIGGEALTANNAIAVPVTAPGATADLLIAMTAPTTSGAHSGQWQMRNASGVLFGPAIGVSINVIAPPASSSSAPAPAGCSGTPNIASFTATSTSITAGNSTTLNWGAVTNAGSAEIDNGIGGIATPGSISVSPASTKTYTLTAKCGAATATKQVTINVTPLVSGITLVLPPLFTILPSVTQVLAQTSVSAGANTSAYAACPSGSVVTSGGFASNHNPDIEVYSSFKDGNGWRTYARNGTASSFTLNTYAICLSNSGGTSTQVLSQASVGANNTGSATATCSSGIATGGGFASSSGVKLYTMSKSSTSGNNWQVYVNNTKATSQLVNAYVICLTGTAATTTNQILKQVNVNAGNVGSATATCPSGTWLTGGGFASNHSPQVKIYTHLKDTSTSSWEVYLNNTSASSQLLNAYAICTDFTP